MFGPGDSVQIRGDSKEGHNRGDLKEKNRGNYELYDQHPLGRILLVVPHFDVTPPYAADPQLRPEVGFSRNAHLVAYPAPPDARAEKAYQTYVIPNMFARAAQSSNKDAIAFAVKALTDIGYSK